MEGGSLLRIRPGRSVALAIMFALAACTSGPEAAVRAISESSPRPANPGPTTEPTPLGAGEVLNGALNLVAQDPDSGAVRTIVDDRSLPGAGDITSAAWSPDRKWVAFRWGLGSSAGSLWVADTIGGAPRQLATAPGYAPWSWSPTEDQLVVVLGHDVALIDAATGRETDLGTTVGAKDIEGYAVHTLGWSPDGTRIAYDGGPGSSSVYSIDVESGEQTLLVRQPAGMAQIKDIDWSPDGAHLAISYLDAPYIASHESELGPVKYKATALYLANADGSDLRLVDHIVASEIWSPGLSAGTAWSPDGIRLAYSNFSGPDHRELEVWTVSVDGSAPSLVASHCCVSDGGGPVWSPDGGQIAFETETGGGSPYVGLFHLVVNADGTGDPRDIDKITYRSWLGGWYFCRCYG
jgi:Tol biopolymer transport system component